MTGVRLPQSSGRNVGYFVTTSGGHTPLTAMGYSGEAYNRETQRKKK
jgi:hypothetical protein